MNTLSLVVEPNTMTVEEFDREVRGFRAKLLAYGDVFKNTSAAPVQPVQEMHLNYVWTVRAQRVQNHRNQSNYYGWHFRLKNIPPHETVQLRAKSPAGEWVATLPRKKLPPARLVLPCNEKGELMPGRKYSAYFKKVA